jgi:hypothetical protein
MIIYLFKILYRCMHVDTGLKLHIYGILADPTNFVPPNSRFFNFLFFLYIYSVIWDTGSASKIKKENEK